jgi:isoleucyl-tRNA synthetase
MSWSSTLRLPKSTFPPRAAFADQAKYLQRCTDDLYTWQTRHRSVQNNSFVLHDGPPYANGGLHVGHALNKILKDIICRTQLARGKRVQYVPGWDCHGLPIEIKALEHHGWKERQASNALAVRAAARAFAQGAVEEQMKGFKSWAVMGDWEGHWKTMDKSFELRQLGVFKEMADRGLIYRKHKPVFWSPSSLTALAEAELEYNEDHVSTAALVKFPIVKNTAFKPLADIMPTLHAVIWTTTPWTLPANQAIAVHEDLTYTVVKSRKHGYLLLAELRVAFVEKMMGENFKVITSNIAGSSLVGSRYRSPPIFEDDQKSRPILHADFVSPDAGTGLVHCAPGHGMEDYQALQPLISKGEVLVRAPVDEAGRFTQEAATVDPSLLLGLDVFGAGNERVLQMLDSSGLLLAQERYTHKYPYDWRTKKPVLIRATAQWFADVSSIRNGALESLEAVDFHPATGKTRLTSFVANRSEWCISRQRAWGVPIPALYRHKTGEAVLTTTSIRHIIKTIEQRGIEAWWSDDPHDPAWITKELLVADDASNFRRGTDTMDVWFDSGTSWTGMSSDSYRSDIPVADVYIEGTDQHRGWFQSSLLTHNAHQVSLTTTKPPVAPFRSLITHGFTLDGEGRKMSKSIGNVVSPDEIMAGTVASTSTKPTPPAQKSKKSPKQALPLGPDVLRLWVASSDFTRDVIVSDTIIKSVHAALHKYRVTIKLLLGNLSDFSPLTTSVPYSTLSLPDRIALHHLHAVSTTVRDGLTSYEFHKAVNALNRWITSDLSNFYIEAVKDILYCSSPSGQRRRAVQTVLHHVLCQLQAMLGPLTPMLVEESWEHSSETLQTGQQPPLRRSWNPIPAEWHDEELEKTYLPSITAINAAVKSVQERARTDKKMGSSLDSDVLLVLNNDSTIAQLRPLVSQLAEILVVSNLHLQSEAGARNIAGWSYDAPIQNAEGKVIGTAHVYQPQNRKCVRCWRYLVVKPDAELCQRCESVVEELKVS